MDILDENEINTTAEILLEDPVGDQEVRDLLFLAEGSYKSLPM